MKLIDYTEIELLAMQQRGAVYLVLQQTVENDKENAEVLGWCKVYNVENVIPAANELTCIVSISDALLNIKTLIV